KTTMVYNSKKAMRPIKWLKIHISIIPTNDKSGNTIYNATKTKKPAN
ncbi:42885_t:CDS:2, partial [Gigaspora margarita]